ncbi:MAG: RagB/SusD family nutrient uptake outer membrane protein, partial [Rudanella sp.]|nr:RagB/SusD family nutrient uptake outer membrane protein [Rudanella sp.]
SIVNAYPNNDPRKTMNMFGPGSTWFISGKGEVPYDRTDWQHKKYSNLYPGGSGDDFENFAGSSINMRVIRYADVLLMYAEALNEQGAKFSAEAVNAVNQVRARVGLAATTAADGASLFQAIITERQLELAFEQHRRKDIVRWGIARDVLGVKFVPGKHEVFPIPQTEIDINPAITQNNGY